MKTFSILLTLKKKKNSKIGWTQVTICVQLLATISALEFRNLLKKIKLKTKLSKIINY